MNFQMLEAIIKALLKVKDEVKKAKDEVKKARDEFFKSRDINNNINDKFNKGEKNESRN